MARSAARPKDWKRIVDAVRFHRAKEQCECTFHCRTHRHYGRCESKHGITTPGEKKATVLKVVPIGEPGDFSPESLLAMCGRCERDFLNWQEKQDAERERMKALGQQMDTMFPDLKPIDPKDLLSRED